MKRAIWLGLSLSLCVVPSALGATKPGPATGGARFTAVTFGILHRVFHDFRDMQTVKLNQDFPLGDTEFSARVVQYVPDFQMDLKSRRVFSLSDQPRNPAFKIIVRKGKVPQDTTWAFFKSPPHFGARSYFAFAVLKIELAGRPPLVADTTGAETPAVGAPHTPAMAADSLKGH